MTKQLFELNLKAGERKKIECEKHGKWLAECDEKEVIHACLFRDDYPDRLGYKLLKKSREMILEVKDYWSERKEIVGGAFRFKFFNLMAEYNDPRNLDKISRINKKVDDVRKIVQDGVKKGGETSEDLQVSLESINHRHKN